MSKIVAPWTDAQVAALNRWQACGHVHPFTCPNRSEPGHAAQAQEAGQTQNDGVLLAITSGWVCMACGYRQDWAHATMLDLPRDPGWWFGPGNKDAP